MCATHTAEPEERPDPWAFLANLRQPGPLNWKLRLLFANTAIKIRRHQPCCEHAGEPGC